MYATQSISTHTSRQTTPEAFPRARGLLQRKCACGNHASGGECAECQKTKLLPRRASTGFAPATVPPIVHEVLRSSGQPLDGATRAFMEPRFGHDFSQVRVHTDARASQSASALRALAFTIGRDIVFDANRFAPATDEGRSLLAHELTHIVQQSNSAFSPHASTASLRLGLGEPGTKHEAEAEESARRLTDRDSKGKSITRLPLTLQRATTLGTKVTHSKGIKSPFKKVQCSFDGADFVMEGDGTAVISVPAQSGRPYSVSAKDAKDCKGSTKDSYMNNPRYVGIKDNGPIPEGEYTFRRSDMTTFSGIEQLKMSLASPGTYSDPSGSDLHGDWGAARAPLAPVKTAPSPFCGDTSKRSGFYLHGGSMPGSSGCIDVGNSAVTDVVEKLDGFTSPVHVKVKYTKAAPAVGGASRAAGRFMYPEKKDPSIWDRIKSATEADED